MVKRSKEGDRDCNQSSEKKFGIASERLEGNDSAKAVYQDTWLAGQKGTKFNLFGWSKHVNVGSTGIWGLQLKVYNIDGTIDTFTAEFNPANANWQQVSRVFQTNKDFTNVQVRMVFDGMPTTAKAWFDEITLNVVDLHSSSVSTYNFAENSSFEYDYDNSSWPDGWFKNSGDTNFTGEWVNLTTSDGNVYTVPIPLNL
jgi:hypothetical protein